MDVNGISPVQNLILKVLPASPAEKAPSSTSGNGQASVVTSQEGQTLAPAASPNIPAQNSNAQGVLSQKALSQNASFQNLSPQGGISQNILSTTVPPQTAQSQAVPAQTVLSQSVPSQTIPAENVPSQTAPSQTAPSQTVSPQTISPQTISPQTVYPKNVLPQNVPPQTVSLPSALIQSTYAQSVPLQNEPLPSHGLPELPLLSLFSNALAAGIEGPIVQTFSTMFRKLGLDYEKRLLKALNLAEPFQSQEFADLKDTVKAQLIEAAKKDPEPKLALDALTSMQLKQNSEQNSQAAYLVMDLPYLVQDKGYQARIVIHGNKKGKAIDTEHCRIGLNTVTDALGEIGIDALFRERTLSVTIMTENPETVSTLWEQLKDSVVEQFASQGYQLISVRVSPLGEEQFDAFIHGIEPKGVDIKV